MMISFAGVDEQTYSFSNLCANDASHCSIGVCCYFPDFCTGFWFHHERGDGQVFVLVRSTVKSGRSQTCRAICCIIFAFMGRLSANSCLSLLPFHVGNGTMKAVKYDFVPNQMNNPMPSLDSVGRAIAIGAQVRIPPLPHWLVHDLPPEDVQAMRYCEGTVMPVVEIDRAGYVWFGTQELGPRFCLRPEELLVIEKQ